MTQKLTKMEIDRIDLVDAGANGRRFALFKRDADVDVAGDEGLAEKRGLVERVAGAVAKALGIPEPVEKSMTFAQIVAGREMSQALEEHWYTLSDALWSAIYATDDEGNDLSLDAKKQLVSQNLDEFKAFLLERMDAGVEKGARPGSARFIQAFVAKVGRKASAARVARLKEAADALGAVLAEVEADEESAETEKRATAQVAKEAGDVTPEELAEAIRKGNEPLVQRIEALEKSGKTEEPAEPVAKGEADDEEGEATLDTVVEAIGKLADRVGAIEKRRGERQSAGGEEAVAKKDAGVFAGIL